MAILSTPLQYVTGTPPVTRALALATLSFSGLYYWLCYSAKEPSLVTIPYLTLMPEWTLRYPWTLVTSQLVETTLVELLFTLLVIPASLRNLEKMWGSIETIKFLAVVTILSNVITYGFHEITRYFVTNRAALDSMEYHGQMSVLTGILVAYTQIIPEHQVQILGIVKLRVKALPMIYLTISTVMTLIGFQCPWIIIQFAWYVSWVYLRFYKKNTGDTVGGVTYGDRSETFALIYWFPPFIHPYLSIPANFVHQTFTKLHLIPTGGPDVESGGYTTVPGGARAEAERRRAIALKALDQHLTTATPGPATSRPASSATPPPPAASVSAPTSGPSESAKPAAEN